VTSFIATAAVGPPGRVADPSPSDAARRVAPGPVFAMGRLGSRISPVRRQGQLRLLVETAARAARSAG
jgi:hypothetical protein